MRLSESLFPSPVAAAALLALVATAGCQQFQPASSTWSLLPWSQPARRPAGSAAETPPERKLTRKQQLEQKFSLARSLEQTGQTNEAAAAYEAILQLDAKHAGAHHRLAVLRDQQGKAQEAEEHFQRATRLDPKNPELLCDYAYCLYVRGRLPEAEQQLKLALARDPQLARAHNNLGLIQSRTGRIQEAMASFQAAGATPAAAHANAAFGLMLEQQWPAAQNELAIALSCDPQYGPARKQFDEVSRVLARSGQSAPSIAQAAPNQPLGPSQPQAAFIPAFDPVAPLAPSHRAVSYSVNDTQR